jgi:hypothetical protein
MTVRVNKPAFNLREKLSELTPKFGLKGTELARAETVQDARDLISAGRRNIFMNGSMAVFQRGSSSTGITNNASLYTLDRWRSEITNGATYTISQDSDAPPGFANSIKYLVTSNAGGLSSMVTLFDQRMEGQNLQQLKFGTSEAKAITVSFWVKSNAPGTYILEAEDQDNVTIINKSYTINQSGVWEYKTVTFPGNTSGSGFDDNNNTGLSIRWWLAAGSNFTSGSTLKDTWGTPVNTERVVGQTNLGATTNNYFMMTGAQLETGTNATEFEHRSYGEELALCQRYYHRDPTNWYQSAIIDGNGTLIGTFIRHPVTMRATPSVNHLVIGAYYWNINGTGNSSITPNGTTSYYAGNQTFGVTNLSGCTNLGGSNNDQITGQFKTQIEYSAEL